MLNGIIYGVSVFVGIVAGVFVEVGVNYINNKRRIIQECKNMKFENECNINKINKWLDLLNDFRNKATGDRINEFSGYFNFSWIIFISSNRMIQNGTLYKVLSFESIEKLQENASQLSLMAENQINGQINQFKYNQYIDIKRQVSYFIDYWVNVLNVCKKKFEDVNLELDKRIS